MHVYVFDIRPETRLTERSKRMADVKNRVARIIDLMKIHRPDAQSEVSDGSLDGGLCLEITVCKPLDQIALRLIFASDEPVGQAKL